MDRQRAEAYFLKTMLAMGLDPDDPELKETPRRFIAYLEEFIVPKPEPKWTVFEAAGKGMVVQCGLPVVALCSHHLAPFTGLATIGYIPKGKQLGLSKLGRLVEHFSHQLQNQERLTSQILDKLLAITGTTDAGVIIRAHHTCMCVRGPRIPNSWTTTSELHGCFLSDAAARQEFWSIHNQHPA